ncbi:MAG: HlyD family type I secretion periplasmic adaptor subunit [Betaproteobacteria bacterium]|jgi:adhesin transport system membrane fusion protein|nr:HlyD family type I secretion periplasmic adaptor subunit [Betaproteobacteria bacterium]
MFKNLQKFVKERLDLYAGTTGSTVAVSAAQGPQVKRASLLLLWGITALFVALFIWITFAEVDTVTRADGRIIPSAKMQVIQNLEGGIVAAILVKQGQQVKTGDRLVALSAVQHDGDMKARLQQVLALEARAARLVALASGQPPKFPKTVSEQAPELMAVEGATFLSKKLEQESQLAVLMAQVEQKNRELDEVQVTLLATRKSLALGREERATVSRLVERGLEPRLELVRIDRSLAEQEGRAEAAAVSIERVRSAVHEISARKDAMLRQFRSDALNELNRTMAELSPLKQAMPALVDKVARTEIKAPMNGIVNRVFVTTLGGIVRPGDPIVEVVPGDDQLVVEALVSPKDIGFVKLGQPARVKVTAYDYAIFGAMDGVVQSISADAVPNEKGEAFFQVRIETKTRAIEAIDKKLPILPGMQAQIDIITGKKTILQFLSKPIVAVKENAFRER